MNPTDDIVRTEANWVDLCDDLANEAWGESRKHNLLAMKRAAGTELLGDRHDARAETPADSQRAPFPK